jgi:hypothetical protein
MQNTNTSKDAAVQLRLGPLFEPVEEWRRNQPKIPNRADAIRELLRRGLGAEQRNPAPIVQQARRGAAA